MVQNRHKGGIAMAKATFNASMTWSGKGVYCEGGSEDFSWL